MSYVQVRRDYECVWFHSNTIGQFRTQCIRDLETLQVVLILVPKVKLLYMV